MGVVETEDAPIRRRVVYVRREDHPYSLRLTLPSRWQKDPCFKVLRVFVESFNTKFGADAKQQKMDVENAYLFGDRSCRVIDLKAPVSEMDEETVWVRVGNPSEETTTGNELSGYVPRALVPRQVPSLDELRVENQTMLVGRAQQILDLFGALSDDRTVRGVRRFRRRAGRGEEERLVVQCDRVRYEIRSVVRDQDDYCDAICRVWNERLRRRPCVPLRREDGKVAGLAFGKKWILRPYNESDPCVDPARLGKTLGGLHARARGVHALALNMMEIRPKSYADRFKEQLNETRRRTLPDAILERIDTIDLEAIASLTPCWTHASFCSDTCRLQGADDDAIVEGIENSRIGTRLEDFYDLVLWDKTSSGLKIGLEALPVVARNYLLACHAPFTTTEATLFPDVLWLRALFDHRKSSARLFDILDQLEAASQDLSAALMDANPKYLEASTSASVRRQLLPPPPPPERDEDDEEEADDDKKEEETASDDFWSTWAREARQEKNKKRRGGVVGSKAASLSSSKASFRDILKDCRVTFDDQGHPSLVEDFQVFQSSGLQRATRLATPTMPQAAACVIHLERDNRRSAHVAEHVRKIVPGVKVIGAVDAMIQGELEKADRPAIDENRWKTPSRGQLACAASHLAAWRSCLDSAFSHLVVLEDDVELAARFLESVALILAEVPVDYDLLYLHVPPDRRREGEGDRFVPAYETTTLTAYVLSLKGAAALVDLVDDKGLDSPIDLFVNARALDGSISAFAVTDKDLARSRGDKSIAHNRHRFLPSTVADTPPWHDLHLRMGREADRLSEAAACGTHDGEENEH